MKCFIRLTLVILTFMFALILVPASSVQAKDYNAPWLKSDIYYYLAVDQGVLNFPWLLGWEGTIEGDVNGVLRYWIDVTETFAPDYVARWEVLDCPPDDPISCPHDALVVMSGYSAGTNLATVDGITDWLGKGIVTFVAPPYERWFGRRMTEGGWYDSDGLVDGWGTFMIYDKPSQKH